MTLTTTAERPIFKNQLLLLTIPVFFVLHRVNENFNLIPAAQVLYYLLLYSVLTLYVGQLALFLVRDQKKSFIFSSALLLVFFLFGAIKDALSSVDALQPFTRYSTSLPLLLVFFAALAFFLRKSTSSFARIHSYILFIALVFTSSEIVNLGINAWRQPNLTFGDQNHKLIEKISIPPSARKPSIFWIILDQYAASSSLRERWNFQNPLDSQLAEKGFFIDDSAKSPYNYTHYSLSSILDMNYLPRLDKRNVVDFTDMAWGNKTIYHNNVLKLLTSNGYDFYNYSIFDLKDHPAKPYIKADLNPAILIHNTTLSSCIERDILWNVYSSGQLRNMERSGGKTLAQNQLLMIEEAQKLVKESRYHSNPSMYMIHYMITHDPFVFNEDGSFCESFKQAGRNGYLSSIAFANKVVNDLVDQIMVNNKDKDYIILVQSDHGFRYNEDEPEFDPEGCKIFHAVYTSDRDYSMWQRGMCSVNTFRVLSNQYFNTHFPLLPVRSRTLKYRKQ